jgi:hypothetical protein
MYKKSKTSIKLAKYKFIPQLKVLSFMDEILKDKVVLRAKNSN